jgi:hypothetical protein
MIRQAAAQEGTSVSEFIRRAVAGRAQETLSQRDELIGIIGAVHSAGGAAVRTGAAFGEMLEERRHGG